MQTTNHVRAGEEKNWAGAGRGLAQGLTSLGTSCLTSDKPLLGPQQESNDSRGSL